LIAARAPRKTSTARRRKKPTGASSGLPATELAGGDAPKETSDLTDAIARDGGRVLATYREPYSGRWVVFAALPIDRVEPTPYQRNISDTHVRRLESVISKLGRFLDPIITVRAPQGTEGAARYWTPNGNHRLTAMRTLGATSITAIVIPEPAAAYQILALNTEKAHNLREKALEVARMYEELTRLDNEHEASYALEFEDPAFITLGLCYQERPRFSGGAYHPLLKRADQFLAKPLRESFEIRRLRATTLLALDDVVNQHVEALKARGLTSPYLKAAVVARINPLRFRPKDAAPLGYDEAMDRQGRGQIQSRQADVGRPCPHRGSAGGSELAGR
jgi:ParB family chromosome partitioning protein